jgi:hypothetical protein
MSRCNAVLQLSDDQQKRSLNAGVSGRDDHGGSNLSDSKGCDSFER